MSTGDGYFPSVIFNTGMAFVVYDNRFIILYSNIHTSESRISNPQVKRPQKKRAPPIRLLN